MNNLLPKTMTLPLASLLLGGWALGADLPEVMNLSHRVALYRGGRIVRQGLASDFTPEQEAQCARVIDGLRAINTKVVRLGGSLDALTATTFASYSKRPLALFENAVTSSTSSPVYQRKASTAWQPPVSMVLRPLASVCPQSKPVHQSSSPCQ